MLVPAARIPCRLMHRPAALRWWRTPKPPAKGLPGSRRVVQVIRNRMADGRFPNDACAVVRAPGEFQPVSDSAKLRLALLDPAKHDMAAALADFGAPDRAVLDEALRLASPGGLPSGDATSGALYFVNPRFMEPAKCPWFADLKRTGEIGQHVFMTHYRPGESKAGPALDCAAVKKWWAAFVSTQAAKGKRGRTAQDQSCLARQGRSFPTRHRQKLLCRHL